MNTLIATRPRRVAWAALAFLLAVAGAYLIVSDTHISSDGEFMKRFLVMPTLAAVATLILLSACAQSPSVAVALPLATVSAAPAGPFMAQVVGVQWLNPLQRRDYPTEWQLLWTLGLATPNKNDDMVRTDPKMFSTLQSIGGLAAGNDGRETFEGFHEKVCH